MLTLTSDNPRLSYVLMKNPASGFVTAQLHEGILAGWYSTRTANTWCAAFIDSPGRSSFSTHGNKESGDYLDLDRYASISIVMNVLREFLDHLLSPIAATKIAHEDVPANQTIILAPLHLPDFRPELHINSAAQMGVQVTIRQFDMPERSPEPSHLYEIVLKMENATIAALVQRTYLLCFMWHVKIAHSKGSKITGPTEDLIDKIAGIIHEVDPPFFIRKHLLLRTVGTTKAATEKYGEMFSVTKSEGPSIHFAAGTNAQIRQRFVEEHLRLLPAFNCLIDFGCGEHPVRKWREWRAKEEPKWRYIAVDSDPKIVESLSKIQNEKCDVVDSLDELQDLNIGAVILATEVVEHLHVKQVRRTLSKLLAVQPMALIMTTPNREFNQYYGMTPSQVRHEDHTHEYDMAEFSELITDVAKEAGYWGVVGPVGDTVNGCSNILGVVLRPIAQSAKPADI